MTDNKDEKRSADLEELGNGKRPVTKKQSPPCPGDPDFDIASIRLETNYADTVGVKKAIVTVPVRKPNRQAFVRVHPSPEYRLETAVLEDKETRETYLIAPELWPELPGEIVPKLLVTAITRQGHVFLWPIRLPGEDGRLDQWNRTAMQAAELAKTSWVRVAANMAIGTYDVFQAVADLPEPEWPDVTFAELVGKAFKDNYIDDLSHPVLQRLRGEK